MSDAIQLEPFDTRMGREWRVLVNRTVVYEGDATGAKNVKVALDEYAHTLTAEVERLLAVQDEILMSRAVANAEVERLRAEVDRHKAAASAVREEALDDAATAIKEAEDKLYPHARGPYLECRKIIATIRSRAAAGGQGGGDHG